MDVRILGSLEVLHEGRAASLGGTKQRALLALLVLHANETVSTERLIDELWGERPPTAAAKTVQVHVSRLRKALAHAQADSPVITREHGYQLVLDPECLDASRFERLIAEGRAALAARRPADAEETLEEALGLWRGRPLEDLAYEPFAQREIARLEDLRIGALEELADAMLALGRHGELVGQLEALIAEHPYRERPRAQLMLALYRCDRQAEALQAYQDARRTLVEELGIEPGERLRELERAVLAQDPELALREREPLPAAPQAEPSEPPAEPESPAVRRLVSIVFADIVGSTGLAERIDPESMHGVLDRYSEVCGAVIERHGGSVEGFIGDAIVGVFGQTQVRDDDALRAVRSALELRDAGAGLSAEIQRERGVELGMKLGIESGEVFVGAGARRSTFAAGDAFNVAARLEGAAREGEILLGERVYELVKGQVKAERLEPLALRGRRAKVEAWRLLGLDDEDVGAPATRFVGRHAELDLLRAAFRRVRDERCCEAVTVVGPPGIGKSRLAREFVSELGDDAALAVGRCPSYGEGATYRPLSEIVGQLAGGDPRRGVEKVLGGDDGSARLVLGAVGLDEAAARPEEIAWAFRRLFERVAHERPLAVVVDDVQWADAALLDLLDYVVAFSSGNPVLLVCLARAELLEMRPAWSAPHPRRVLVTLEALSDDLARQLIDSAAGAALGTGTAERIVETAEGNPLFLEQLAAVGAEGGPADLPTTLQAVLAARIDRLGAGERTVLEHASVQGRSFYVGALEELLPDTLRTETSTRLVSLVHKQLIRPQRGDFPGEDAFRFAHVLIREAAYRGLPKERRGELHEQVARWLEARADSEDEAIGHHLAEAHRNRAELGHAGVDERRLAAAAASRLAAAADAAQVRGDPGSAARLLERATTVLAGEEAPRHELLPELGAALFEAGRLTDAVRVLDEAVALAPEERFRVRAQVERELVRIDAEPSAGTAAAERAAAEALPVLEREGDEYGRCRAWLLRGLVAWNAGHVAAADEAWTEAAECAQRAGTGRLLFEIVGWRALAAALGPTPVPEAIGRCEELGALVESSPLAHASTLNPLALLHAMAGDFELAEQLVEQAGEILQELGGQGSGVSHLETFVRLLLEQPARVEECLREDVETLSAMGNRSALATTTALLAHAVYALGRAGEAGELCATARAYAAAEDTVTQTIWRCVQAKVLATEGRCAEAQALAREAVELVARTDLLWHRGDAMLDLARVLATCMRTDDAELAQREAIALYELKGHVVAAARAHSPLSHRRGGM